MRILGYPWTGSFALLLLLAFTLPAFAQAPDSLAYQTFLTDSEGTPADGMLTFTFRLYASEVGGVPVWSETQPDMPINNGNLTAYLGAVSSLSDVAFDGPLWLSVEVNSDGEMMPRSPLVSVPYALSLRSMRIQPVRDGLTSTVNIIGGSPINQIPEGTLGATIGGGGYLHDTHDFHRNHVNGDYGTIGGGYDNHAGHHSTVAGGRDNDAGGSDATIAGGAGNRADGPATTVSGGVGNIASAPYSTVPGGRLNEANSDYGFAAGRRAISDHSGTFVWADQTNADFTSTGQDQFLIRATGGVGIGTNNPGSPLTVAGIVESTTGGFKFPDGTTQATAATGVGSGWTLNGNAGTTAGTDFVGTTDDQALEFKVNNSRTLRLEPKTGSDGPNVIAGWSSNATGAGVYGATISGGGDPTPGGGLGRNQVNASYGTIGGGYGNTTTSAGATIAGGDNNNAGGVNAAIGGGWENVTGGWYAAIAGGAHNGAAGQYAAIPGGLNNTAVGNYSFAAGRFANAATEGSFVWQDATAGLSGPALTPSDVNQFVARASGGFFFHTAAAGTTDVGAQLPDGSGSWSSMSSRDAKTAFRPVDLGKVLDEVASLQIQRWRYEPEDVSIEHMGPMAEEFYEAFGLGHDAGHIATVDADGVALAAIQALHDLVQQQGETIQSQQAQIDELRSVILTLER